MRNEGIIKTLAISTIALVILVVLNNFALGVVRRQYAPGTSSGVSIFNLSGQVNEWFGYVQRWKDLTAENASLSGTAKQYVSVQAQLQELQAENDILRKTAGLSVRLKRRLVPAGIFDVSLMPDGYHALLNKGTSDGVAVGQAIISPEGILVGKVAAAFPSSSRVMLVMDPAFSATVRVLSGQTSGILRGALADGMNLSLVTQSDAITEGDTLVTTGNDLVPAGLVIGTVRLVENNDTQLFKKVSVNPAMNPSQGSVLVVEQ
jgi:rod shape-determining protein MreC